MAAYWKIAAHSAYDMFSQYEYLISNLFFILIFFIFFLFYFILFYFFFSHLGFRSENFSLIVPFPDHCLLLPFPMLGLDVPNKLSI